MVSTLLLLFCITIGASLCSGASMIYIPLDERFTTRDAFINLAKVTPNIVRTPPPSMLPRHKVPADLKALNSWMDDHISQKPDGVILSAEMILYGGLINSRISNDTTEVIQQRLKHVISYKEQNPQMSIYLSTVVMRIPAYNGDFEEPWYWAQYGQLLFTYSYYWDEYQVTGNTSAEEKALAAKAQIPPNVLQKFLWRRERNFNITCEVLKAQKEWVEQKGKLLFRRIFITLDDNALYGFNIREAARLKDLVQQYSLQNTVDIYPGADEVGLTMLRRFTSDLNQYSPKFQDPKTIYYIPNYEGQPMIDTIHDQIRAAGGTIANGSSADILFLVNNFSEKHQIEAPNQPLNRSVSEYDVFVPFLDPKRVIGFADVRYSNGADIIFVKWIGEQQNAGKVDMAHFAYAGWNTDGNTLGTVVSNSILLHFFKFDYFGIQANKYFNSLRFLEDNNWQATLRQDLVGYVTHVTGDSINALNTDLDFYTRYAWKRLNSDYKAIVQQYRLSFHLDCVYYPWNRTFEIGFNEKELSNCFQ